MLIGGPGIDVLDGGDGDDIEIQLVGDTGDAVTSATVAGSDWLTKHVEVVDGKTLLDVGGKHRTLPHTDLSGLVQAASK